MKKFVVSVILGGCAWATALQATPISLETLSALDCEFSASDNPARSILIERIPGEYKYTWTEGSDGAMPGGYAGQSYVNGLVSFSNSAVDGSMSLVSITSDGHAIISLHIVDSAGRLAGSFQTGTCKSKG